MKRVFPDRPIVDISTDATPSSIPSTISTTASRCPARSISTRAAPPKRTATEPHWRGIYDDNGRIMVAICFNVDLGDSWEWADVPQYPAKFSDLGIRIGVNYIVYAMTH